MEGSENDFGRIACLFQLTFHLSRSFVFLSNLRFVVNRYYYVDFAEVCLPKVFDQAVSRTER